MTTTSTATDIREAFEFANLTTTTSRWGHTQHVTTTGHIISVTDDDGAIFITVFTGHELIESQMQLSGRLTNPVALANILATITNDIEDAS